MVISIVCFKSILNHCKNNRVIDKPDQYRVSHGTWIKKKTTSGWDLEIEWKEGSTSWLPLKELKETNSVEVAQWAVDNRIDTEPAFDWWVQDHLKHQKRPIKLSQQHSLQPGYKFGIQLPRNVDGTRSS